jgi:hypothetical protein
VWNPGDSNLATEIENQLNGRIWRCHLYLARLSTQNTNVSVFPNLQTSVAGSGGGQARNPRCNAAPERRPLYGCWKLYHFSYRAASVCSAHRKIPQL